MSIVRIGVLTDQKAAERRWAYGLNVFGRYIGEILAHAGIPFEWLDRTNYILENKFDIVIIGIIDEDEAAYNHVWRYLSKGGIAISYAGLNRLAQKLGFRRGANTGPGYAHLPPGLGDMRPLRYLDAVPWIPLAQGAETRLSAGNTGPSSVSQSDGATFPVLQQIPVENGVLDRWSIDIVQTVVGMQQGTRPLMEDGSPAPDGTAPLDDGQLKAEDRIELDWRRDRQQTDTGALYFAHPYADLWREALVAHLLRRAAGLGKVLPFVGYWPAGIRQVAMLSHDSDRNHNEDAETTLALLEECDVHSTWCMMKPGYRFDILRRVQESGHELALHYNSNENEGGGWSQDDFTRQYEWLRQAAGCQTVTSNKNHFTRFEGWGELYSWCERCGIESDQTNGPTKKGTAGFLFGTCRPHYPIAWADERNRLYDVLEIGFLSQDISSFTDFSVVEPLLEQVKLVSGVAHFLFHQGRIHSSEAVKESLRRVVKTAKEMGFTFWTGKRINDWERARRRIRILGSDDQGEVWIDSVYEADGVEIFRPLLDGEEPAPGAHVEIRFGVPCLRLSIL